MSLLFACRNDKNPYFCTDLKEGKAEDLGSGNQKKDNFLEK